MEIESKKAIAPKEEIKKKMDNEGDAVAEKAAIKDMVEIENKKTIAPKEEIKNKKNNEGDAVAEKAV